MKRSFSLVLVALAGARLLARDPIPIAGLEDDYATIFKECDRNKDGTITAAELASFNTRLKAPIVRGRDVQKLEDVLIVPKDAPDAAPRQLVAWLKSLATELNPDGNDDGKVTREEFDDYVTEILHRREALIAQARVAPIVPLKNPLPPAAEPFAGGNLFRGPGARDRDETDAERRRREERERDEQRDREEEDRRRREAENREAAARRATNTTPVAMPSKPAFVPQSREPDRKAGGRPAARPSQPDRRPNPPRPEPKPQPKAESRPQPKPEPKKEPKAEPKKEAPQGGRPRAR